MFKASIFEMTVGENGMEYFILHIYCEDKAFSMREEYYNHYNEHFLSEENSLALCSCSIQVC